MAKGNGSKYAGRKTRGKGLRPFKIWNASEKKNVAHRCYGDEERAKERAFLLVKGEHVGVAYEVYDDRTKAWIATYARKVASVYIDEKVTKNGR